MVVPRGKSKAKEDKIARELMVEMIDDCVTPRFTSSVISDISDLWVVKLYKKVP